MPSLQNGGGGFTGNGSEKIWHLTPTFLGSNEMEYGIPSYDGIEADGIKDYIYKTTYEDGFYTLPMSDFSINPNGLNQREEEVYGNLDNNCEYAEIFVGTHRAGGYCDFAALLLVKFEHSPVLTVEDTEGNAYALTELRTPPTLTAFGDTWPADFVDGVYTVTVPKNTQDLRIALGDLANVAEGENPETYAFFSKLGGLQGNSGEKIWHPDLRPINDEYVYGIPSYEGIEADGILEFIHAPAFSDGFYTLPMDDFALDTSNLSYLQTELYGTLDSSCDYAEVFVGTIQPGGYFDFDTLLLIQVGGDQQEENMTPVRKVGVSAATTEELDALEYSINLSAIFEDLDGDTMTYKVKKSTDAEYTTLSGSVFSCVFNGLDVTYQFTANDGIGDGAIYKVTLTATLLGMIRSAEVITSDNSNYWTEYDFFISPTQHMRSDYALGNDISMGYYSLMLNYLQDAKDVYDSGGSAYSVNRAREYLKTALGNLMIKDKVNVSRLWLAVTAAEKRLDAIDDYTELTTGGLDTALAAAKTVYTDELYLSAL